MKPKMIFLAAIRNIRASYVAGVPMNEIFKKLQFNKVMSYPTFTYNMRKYVKASKRKLDILMLNDEKQFLEQKPETGIKENNSLEKLRKLLEKSQKIIDTQNNLLKQHASSVENTNENSKNDSSVNELASLLSELIDQKAMDRTTSSFEDIELQDDDRDERNDDKEDTNPRGMTTEQKLKLTENLSPEEKFHFRRKYLNSDEERILRRRMTDDERMDYSYERSRYEVEQEDKENSQ